MWKSGRWGAGHKQFLSLFCCWINWYPVNSSTPRSILSNMHSITEPESLAWTGFSQVPQSKAVGEPDWVNSGSMSTEPYLLIKDDLAFNVPFNVKATRCSGRNTIHKLCSIWYGMFGKKDDSNVQWIFSLRTGGRGVRLLLSQSVFSVHSNWGGQQTLNSLITQKTHHRAMNWILTTHEKSWQAIQTVFTFWHLEEKKLAMLREAYGCQNRWINRKCPNSPWPRGGTPSIFH